MTIADILMSGMSFCYQGLRGKVARYQLSFFKEETVFLKMHD